MCFRAVIPDGCPSHRGGRPHMKSELRRAMSLHHRSRRVVDAAACSMACPARDRRFPGRVGRTACHRTAPPRAARQHHRPREPRTQLQAAPLAAQITMDTAYGATADETNPFSKAEMGEAQDLKPVLAPVFVQPLRSRAKRRRRPAALAAVLAVVVTASKLAQQHPHAALERVAKAVRGPGVESRSPVRRQTPTGRGRTSRAARRNLRIFLGAGRASPPPSHSLL